MIKLGTLFIKITIALLLGLDLALDIIFINLYAQEESNINMNQNRSQDLHIVNKSIVQLFDKLDRKVDRIAEMPTLNISVERLVHRLDNMSVEMNGIKSLLDDIRAS